MVCMHVANARGLARRVRERVRGRAILTKAFSLALTETSVLVFSLLLLVFFSSPWL